MRIDGAEYQRVLGEELRKLRKKHGWTRKELNQRLQSEISLQTLATYELGTRHCSVVRLVELCLALDELPQDLLAKVHQRIFTEDADQIKLDLRKIVATDQSELMPLRRWAGERLSHSVDPNSYVLLDLSSVHRMAELCGLSTMDLLSRLRKLTPSSSPSSKS